MFALDSRLDTQRLRAAAGGVIGREIVTLEETRSTNDVARHRAEDGAGEGLVVFAESQTHGRGRRGAEWSSLWRRDLLFSVLLRPSFPAAQWPRLTHMAAIALCEAIESHLPVQPKVKWPNDIYLGDRKVAGLLLESFFPATGLPFAILGVGINVNAGAGELPEGIAREATSLRIATGGTALDREAIAARVLNSLDRWYHRCADAFELVLEQVRARSFLLGRPVTATLGSKTWSGLAVDHSADGSLIVIEEDGSRSLLTAVDRIRALD